MNSTLPLGIREEVVQAIFNTFFFGMFLMLIFSSERNPLRFALPRRRSRLSAHAADPRGADLSAPIPARRDAQQLGLRTAGQPDAGGLRRGRRSAAGTTSPCCCRCWWPSSSFRRGSARSCCWRSCTSFRRKRCTAGRRRVRGYRVGVVVLLVAVFAAAKPICSRRHGSRRCSAACNMPKEAAAQLVAQLGVAGSGRRAPGRKACCSWRC